MLGKGNYDAGSNANHTFLAQLEGSFMVLPVVGSLDCRR